MPKRSRKKKPTDPNALARLAAATALIAGIGALSPVHSGEEPAVRQERAIREVIALFDEADIVAYGEHHGSRLNADFRTRLVTDAAFGQKVDLIVIESANAHHQVTLDRYISGKDVPRADLVKVWRDTGYPLWDSPIYEDFLAAVREANRTVHAGKKLRVLAGDMAVDWNTIRTGRDLIPYMDRGDFPLHLVECEVLKKGRKALLVYGSGHLYHGDGTSFVATLDLKYRDRIRVLEVTPWIADSMKRLREMFGLGNEPRLLRIAGTPAASWNLFDAIYGRSFGSEPTLGKAVDGVIYLGTAPDTIVKPDARVLDEPVYKRERQRRGKLLIEAGRLLEQGDVAGYREWSEYTCPE